MDDKTDAVGWHLLVMPGTGRRLELGRGPLWLPTKEPQASSWREKHEMA